MSMIVSRLSFSHITGFVCTGVMTNLLPNRKTKNVRNKVDLVYWFMDRAVKRETNVQIVARQNIKKQLLSK